jgi:hypothetical protein
MEKDDIKNYGYKNYFYLKKNLKNRKKRRRGSIPSSRGSSNSCKCCPFCSPTFSIRCENKRQINHILKYENNDI